MATKAKVLRIVIDEATEDRMVEVLVDHIGSRLNSLGIVGVIFVEEEECQDVENEQR